MVKQRMDLLELVRNRAEDADLDFLREAMGVLVQAIMEAEVAVQIGAEHGERSPGRLTQRNGYRPRPWDTRVGTLELQIPRVREGSYFPTLLEPRRRSERALLAVVQQAKERVRSAFTEPPHPLGDGRAGDAEQAGHFGLRPAVHHLFDQFSASHGGQACVTMGHEGPSVAAGFRSHNSNSGPPHLSTTSMGTTSSRRRE